MVIVADSTGKELRALVYSEFDFEIGDEVNDFEIKILTDEWEEIPQDGLLYVPNTEYGGIYKITEIDTKQGYISAGGLTWRGMLQSKVLEPPDGENYAIDEGDINTIISNRVADAFGGFFVGASACGVYVEYQYNRFVTLYEGLKDMLSSVGYRLRLTYNQVLKKVVVDAVPIVDYSDKIEFSDDMRTTYYVKADNTGVNHLICLGNGQLKDRIRVDLYTDENGNISTTQTFTGVNEIVQVYDYAGADRAQLIQSGKEQLKTLRAVNQFSIDVEGENIEVGDIVGGKDYVSGFTMTAPVTGKIFKSVNGYETTEYTISNNVEVTV